MTAPALRVPATAPPITGVTLPARSPAAEARAAMALVALLRAHAVPPREIAVVAPRLAPYESALTRAANRRGLTLSLWTQLPMTDTEPYRLVHAVCDILGTETPLTAAQLLRPLAHGWCPPSEANTASWPLAPATLRACVAAAPADSRPRQAWQDDTEWLEAPCDQYRTWLAAQPTAPSSAAVTQVLAPLVERYREHALPATMAADGPALETTTRRARAVTRLRELLPRLQTKYDQRLADDTAPSWATIGELLDTLATTHPGRREHANAQAIDAFEAIDMWGRQRAYVIALGLVDGRWPTAEPGPLPLAITRQLWDGTEPLGPVMPQATDLGTTDRIAFYNTALAARKRFIGLYHTAAADGTACDPSPLLTALPLTPLSAATTRALRAATDTWPPALTDRLGLTEATDE